MSQFIKPRFKQVSVHEAVLKRSDVEKYAKENGVSISDATEVLGREYLAKYANYSQVYDPHHTTRLELIKPNRLQQLQDEGHSIDFCTYCSAHTVDGWCDNCGN